MRSNDQQERAVDHCDYGEPVERTIFVRVIGVLLFAASVLAGAYATARAVSRGWKDAR